MNISMPEELYDYIVERAQYSTVSEYIRSLVHRDRQRRADHSFRLRDLPRRANHPPTFVEALDRLEKLKAVLERRDTYDL